MAMPIHELGPERDSQMLFGNRHRAAVWRAVTRFAIEPPETFTYAGIAEIIEEFENVSPSTIHKEVKLLEAFDMLERQGNYTGDAIGFTRIPSPFWQIAEATAVAFDAVHSPGAKQE